MMVVMTSVMDTVLSKMARMISTIVEMMIVNMLW